MAEEPMTAEDRAHKILVDYPIAGRAWCDRCEHYDHECGCKPSIAEFLMMDMEATIAAHIKAAVADQARRDADGCRLSAQDYLSGDRTCSPPSASVACAKALKVQAAIIERAAERPPAQEG